MRYRDPNARWIPSPNFSASRNGHDMAVPPSFIVIHTTVGTLDATVAHFQNPASQVSAHYIVGWDGSRTQMVDEGDGAWHCGVLSQASGKDNLDSIGIEHVDNGNYNGVRPDALYAAAAQLVREIVRRYPASLALDRAHILKHSEVIQTGCPDSLDIDRIVRQAAVQGDSMTQDQINTWVRSTFQQGRGSQPKDIAERDYWAAQVAANGLEATYVELMGHPDFVTYQARLLAALNAGGGVGPAGPQGPPGPMPDVSGFSIIGHDHQVSGTAK